MPNSINWKIATLAAELTADGLIDSDALAFDLPIDVAVKTPSTSFSSSTWPGNLVSLNSTYDENGVLYIAAEDADFEGAATFWDSGENKFETISFTEWGGTQGVQTATITETSTPDYNTQYKDANVTLSSPSTANKGIGEDPLASRSWTQSGTTVTLSSTTSQNITVYNPNLQGNTDGSTTITLTLTDNQGQTDTDTITISWRANRNPTAPTGLSFNRTQPVAPGTSVTVTASGATDPEGDTIYYQFEQVGTTPALSISSSWSTSTSRSFTVPEYDDGSDSWSLDVRARTSRSSSGVDPSSWFTTTFTGKRPRRYAHEIRVVTGTIGEYSRGSGTSAFNPGNISYPSGIGEGEMLYLSFGAYNAPGNVTWNSINTSPGAGVAIKGDNLGSPYSTGSVPNASSGSPDIVSVEGWERAYNTASNSSRLTPEHYARSSCSPSHPQDYQGTNNLSCTTTLDQFYKITDGNESGTIPLWDWTPTSTFGYAHTHIGEGVFVIHLKAYDEFGNQVKISEISQIYANNRAWNRKPIGEISGTTNTSYAYWEYDLTQSTIGGDGLTGDAIFMAMHVMTNGFYDSNNNKYRIDAGSSTTTNHGLYDGFGWQYASPEGYRVLLSAYEGSTISPSYSGDTSSGGTGYTNSFYTPDFELAEYTFADNLRIGRLLNTEFWNSNGNANNNDGIGTSGGVFIYGAQHFNTLCIRGESQSATTVGDVSEPNPRDNIYGRYYREYSNDSRPERYSSAAVAILQVRAHDTLYDGAY